MALFGQNTIPAKDPTANLDYGFSWVSWLQTGETITAATVTVPAGITLAQPAAINGGIVIFWLSGGAPNQAYLVECEVMTSAGRTDSRSFLLACQVR